MRHIIVTRSGVGIARPTFYRQRLALLRSGLHKCLSAQTNQNFEWVIAVDRHIDDQSRQEFSSLCSDHPNFRVVEIDPIANGTMSPSVEEVLGKQQSGVVAISRLDDDDLIHMSWVDVMSAALREHTGELPASFAIEHGLDLSPGARRFRHFHHPTTPVGITLVTTEKGPRDIFYCNHNKLHENVAALGGTTWIISTDDPMWIYVRHTESETADLRSAKLAGLTSIDKTSGEALWSTLRKCGIRGDWSAEIVRVYAEYKDPKPPLIEQIPRMGIKRTLLKALERHRKDSGAYQAIVIAFYAI